MSHVKPKKSLGQHFLKDEEKAKQIVAMLSLPGTCNQVLEVGPGMGILTQFLFERIDFDTKVVDIDKESVHFLINRFPGKKASIINSDFLQLDFNEVFKGSFAIIGNFPYNISSQILFRVLDERNRIPEVVGMFQKEVAERIAGRPGSREYGILSVFMQAWYAVEVVMQLNEDDFSPPPKVKSAVLHFMRKQNFTLPCDEALFRRVVKTAFNQRRKTLRNALSQLVGKELSGNLPFSDLRAEALSWEKFTELTITIEKIIRSK